MQGDQAAFTELGVTDLQNAIGQYVSEPEVERLGNAESGRSNQPEQRSVNPASKWIRGAQTTGRCNELRNLLRCVDVGQTAALGCVKRIRRHLVGRILGVQETG